MLGRNMRVNPLTRREFGHLAESLLNHRKPLIHDGLWHGERHENPERRYRMCLR